MNNGYLYWFCRLKIQRIFLKKLRNCAAKLLNLEMLEDGSDKSINSEELISGNEVQPIESKAIERSMVYFSGLYE